eukprot:1115406-Rhodomonas_salina.1
MAHRHDLHRRGGKFSSLQRRLLLSVERAQFVERAQCMRPRHAERIEHMQCADARQKEVQAPPAAPHSRIRDAARSDEPQVIEGSTAHARKHRLQESNLYAGNCHGSQPRNVKRWLAHCLCTMCMSKMKHLQPRSA